MIFVRPLGQSIIWRLDLLSKTNFISRSVWIRTAWRPVGVYTVPNIRSRLGNKIDNNKGRYYLLSKEFYEARNEASEQARLRDECFESAKNAYDIGYWANAKRFSDEGRKHEVLMEQANQRAVHEVLAPQHLKESNTIDLHGLHVAEATLATKLYIYSQIKSKRFKSVEIVTGVGRHSDLYKGAVLRPALLELCYAKGWRVEKHDHNSGAFTVHIYSHT